MQSSGTKTRRKRPAGEQTRTFAAMSEKPDGEEAQKPASGKMNVSFFFLVIVLLSIGLVMVFSASYATSLQEKGNSLYIVSRHAMYVAAGLVVMMVASYVDYHIYRKLKWLMYVGCIGLMLWALTFTGVADARRWIYIGSFSFQPSELMKFVLIVMCAHLVASNYKRMGDLKHGIFPFLVILIPVAGVMALQRHFSGLLIMVILVGAMMFIGGSKLRWFALALGSVVAGGVGIILFKGFGYIQDRLSGWLDPFADIKNKTWQIAQSLYAIGSGGLMGVGLGNSTQKYLYISEPQNDFIFAIICEELGFLGAVVIILLFVLLVYCGFSIALKAPDKFGCMLVTGLTFQVGLQALLNIAVVSNAIPTTGISLPFISAGGSALIVLMGEMGVILNVSRHCTGS